MFDTCGPYVKGLNNPTSKGSGCGRSQKSPPFERLASSPRKQNIFRQREIRSGGVAKSFIRRGSYAKHTSAVNPEVPNWLSIKDDGVRGALHFARQRFKKLA